MSENKPSWKTPRLIAINPFGGRNLNPYELPLFGNSAVGWTPSFAFVTIDTVTQYPGVQDVDGGLGYGVVLTVPGSARITAQYSTVAPYS